MTIRFIGDVGEQPLAPGFRLGFLGLIGAGTERKQADN
jgi:hypothetical protein